MVFNKIKQKQKTGGGWRAHSDNALDPYNGASLLEGARGGEACYSSKEIGIHGQGGFGGGGGGCRTGGIITHIHTHFVTYTDIYIANNTY